MKRLLLTGGVMQLSEQGIVGGMKTEIAIKYIIKRNITQHKTKTIKEAIQELLIGGVMQLLEQDIVGVSVEKQ